MCAGRKEPESFQGELCHVGGAGNIQGVLPMRRCRAVVMGKALTHRLVVLDELDTAHNWEGTPLWCACTPCSWMGKCKPAACSLLTKRLQLISFHLLGERRSNVLH